MELYRCLHRAHQTARIRPDSKYPYWYGSIAEHRRANLGGCSQLNLTGHKLCFRQAVVYQRKPRIVPTFAPLPQDGGRKRVLLSRFHVPTTVIPVTYSSVPESCADTNALGTRQRSTRKISFDIARRLSKSSSSLRANVTSAKRSKSMRALDLLIFGGDDCCKIAITLIEIPARGVSALSQT